jgi:hypothetical protein
MTTGEIPISRINAGDSVFYDGKIQVVRGRVRVSHPSRTILFTEDGRSISLTDGTLIERVDEGLTTTRYLGPSWVCGMPEKTEISTLEPGDLILNPDAEIVTAQLKTSNGYVLISNDIVEPHMPHVRFHNRRDRIRLIARGFSVQLWAGPSAIDKIAVEILASDVTLPSEIVSETGVESIDSIASEGDTVTFMMHNGSKTDQLPTDLVICLQPIPEPELTAIHTEAAVISFRCVNGHLTKPEHPIEDGQRFIECPICGLPASAVNQPTAPAPVPVPVPGQSIVAKFCGSCGRARKSENAFCTGCGNRFSKIDTTGFQA